MPVESPLAKLGIQLFSCLVLHCSPLLYLIRVNQWVNSLPRNHNLSHIEGSQPHQSVCTRRTITPTAVFALDRTFDRDARISGFIIGRNESYTVPILSEEVRVYFKE